MDDRLLMYEMVFEWMLFRLDTFSVLMPLKTLVCVCVVMLPMEQFCTEAFPIAAFDIDTFKMMQWYTHVTYFSHSGVTHSMLKE